MKKSFFQYLVLKSYLMQYSVIFNFNYYIFHNKLLFDLSKQI